MRFTITALLAASAAMAVPTTTPEDGPFEVAKRTGTTHVVWVGDTISPDNIQAAIGDTVEFHFLPGIHSVVQSSYTDPCSSNGGFSSSSLTTYNHQSQNDYAFVIDITSDKRIWYYNGFGQACKNGVVGAINSPETRRRSLEGFRRAAKTEGYSENPLEVKGGYLVRV